MAGARDHTELLVYRLADELRRCTYELTVRPPFQSNFKLRDQTEDAAESICRNIAEGFGCVSHREFARFLVIARRSLNELSDCLTAARQKGHVSDQDLQAARDLTHRVRSALNRFIAYLTCTPDVPGK